MATRNRRNEWHQVHGRWTRSLGERGMRVRIFEKRRNGTFYRTTWVPGRGRDHAIIRAVAGRRPVSAAMGELVEHLPCFAGPGLRYLKWGLAGCGRRACWPKDLAAAIAQMRRANADRSRSIGVRREPQGWWHRPRRWYQD